MKVSGSTVPGQHGETMILSIYCAPLNLSSLPSPKLRHDTVGSLQCQPSCPCNREKEAGNEKGKGEPVT